MIERAQSQITIITLGESTVGKSAYISKFVDGKFKNYLPTIGFNIMRKNFSLPNEKMLKYYLMTHRDKKDIAHYHLIS